MMHAALVALIGPLDAPASWGAAFPMLAMFHLHVMEHVQQWMHAAGYPVLFGLLFSCGLGFPLPEDVPLLFAGYFVATGEMHLLPAATCAWCGIIGGDCVLYAIGRWFGDSITRIPVLGSHIKPEQIGRLHEHFERYGVWVVAVGRLFAGIRGAMVLVAGMIRFTFVHFLIADGLAAVLSGGLFMALGYYAGRKFGDLRHVHHEIERYSKWILLGVVVLAIVGLGWLWWQKRQKRRGGSDTAPPVTPASDTTPVVPSAPPTL